MNRVTGFYSLNARDADGNLPYLHVNGQIVASIGAGGRSEPFDTAQFGPITSSD